MKLQKTVDASELDKHLKDFVDTYIQWEWNGEGPANGETIWWTVKDEEEYACSYSYGSDKRGQERLRAAKAIDAALIAEGAEQGEQIGIHVSW